MTDSDSLQALDRRLERLENALEAEGGMILSALWLLPAPPPPETWLFHVAGEKGGMPSADLAKMAVEHFNCVGFDLLSGTYAPVYAVDDDSGQMAWEFWSEGFGEATGLYADDFRSWVDDGGETGDAFRLLIALSGIAMRYEEMMEDLDAEGMAEAAPDLIPECLGFLFQARRKASGAGLPRVREIRTGRNDPCPCGSGRKFKKCCGAN